MKHRDHTETLEATFDSLTAAPAEPDPTTPDPVAYLRDWITWAKARLHAGGEALHDHPC